MKNFSKRVCVVIHKKKKIESKMGLITIDSCADKGRTEKKKKKIKKKKFLCVISIHAANESENLFLTSLVRLVKHRERSIDNCDGGSDCLS